MRKFAAFDIEICKEIPVGTKDFRDYAPYGIACAALAIAGDDNCNVEFWEGNPKLTADECDNLIDRMYDLINDDYTIVTWNGCQFDFFALAQESGAVEDCATLALEHIDLMLQFTFTEGHYLGLDKALAGAGLGGKIHNVVLSTGEKITDMHGSKAPKLWKQGEREAVLYYLRGDVMQLLALVMSVQMHKRIRWVSGAGTHREVTIPELLTVEECFDLPIPDTSWMSNPPKREGFVDWILDYDLLGST